ncbi:hypothetical protein BC828DRAFT_403136 [Blastocladiella britannica]|nr:hypothetical protein BC828DRAFT_403136 [Blastocladiella britannica]
MIPEIANIILQFAVYQAETPGYALEVQQVLPYDYVPGMVRACLSASALEKAMESSFRFDSGEQSLWNMRYQVYRGAQTSISLKKASLGVKGMAILRLLMSVPSHRVTEIDISCTHFGNKGAQALATMLTATPPRSSLMSLIICWSSIGLLGGLALAAATYPPRFKVLRFVGVFLSEKGVRILASNLPPSLSVLEISSARFSDPGAADLASHLPRLQHLTELRLSSNLIGDAGIRALAAHFPRSLTVLDLFENNFGSEGIRALAEHLPTTLIQLRFSGKTVDDESALRLAAWMPPTLLLLIIVRGLAEGCGKEAVRRAWASEERVGGELRFY